MSNYNISMGIFRNKLKTCKKCGRVHSGKNCKSGRGRGRGYYRSFEKNQRYNDIIKSKEWQKLANEIKEIDDFCCVICRSLGLASPNYLEVHHIKKVLEDEGKAFSPDNLATLCIVHHKQADFKYISEDELYSLIKKYRKKTYKKEENLIINI